MISLKYILLGIVILVVVLAVSNSTYYSEEGNITRDFRTYNYSYTLQPGEAVALRQLAFRIMDNDKYIGKDSMTEKYNYVIINSTKIDPYVHISGAKQSYVGCLEIDRIYYNGYIDLEIQSRCDVDAKFNIDADITITVIDVPVGG